MDWRVYLTADKYESDVLVERFAVGPLVAQTDSNGTYLGGALLDGSADAEQVLKRVRAALPSINGMAKMMDGGFRQVNVNGQVRDGEAPTMKVFAEVHFSGRGRMSVTGVVGTIDGQALDAPNKQISDLWAMRETEPFKKALTILGSSADPNLYDSYKIFELMRELEARRGCQSGPVFHQNASTC